MRKRTKTHGASRRLGGNAIDYERIAPYAPNEYASTSDYRGAQAFDASRYRDRTGADYAETARQRENSPTPEAADDYSVATSGARYAAASKRRRRKRAIFGGIGAAAALVAVLVFGLFGGINSALHNGLDASLWNVLTKVGANEPFYLLLMGTDESQDRQDDPELAGMFRTDTIILARVEPAAQAVSLVSIPRDTQVELDGYGTQKINAAHTFGGATLAVQTVEDLTGVAISHYAEIDFDGFIGLVDTLGGIEVDVPMTIDDEDAGGHVDAGLQTLNSWQALTLCRARNAYEEVVGQGDLYRAANQRLVLGAILKKILASDPATMAGAIKDCSQYVRTDFDINDLLDLAQRFQGFDTENKLYTAVFPTVPEYSDDLWWDIAQQNEWDQMRERMDAGLSPASEDVVDPTTGTILATAGDSARGHVESSEAGTHSGAVVVRNGSGFEGAGAKAAETLQALGFATDVANADSSDYSQTTVVYGSISQAGEAGQIARALGCGTTFLNDGTYAFEGDYLVVIGADWQD